MTGGILRGAGNEVVTTTIRTGAASHERGPDRKPRDEAKVLGASF